MSHRGVNMPEAHLFSKVVISGEYVEVYTYSSAIKVGQERPYDIVRRDGTELDRPAGKREDNLYRARQTVRRLIWANWVPHTKFLTLTYRDTVLDVKKVRRDITTFVQRMVRKGYDMQYLYVLERQKERGEKEGNEGCWHVHMVLFISDKIPFETLNACWSHGFVDIHSVRDIKNMGAYISKYITKDTAAELGNRSFSCSLGLKRPQTENFYLEGYSDSTYNGLHPKDVIDALNVTYNSSIRHDYRGTDGVGHTQVVGYYQGRWKDGNLIEVSRENDTV